MSRIYTHENIAGRKFGKLTVLAEAHIINGDRFWHCRCECGKDKVVRGRSLKSGATTSCGCYSRDLFIKHSRAAAPSRRKCRIVATGQRFGKLVAIEYLSRGRSRHGSWLCKCDCGADKIVRSYALASGEVVSCGCLWKENVRRTLLRVNTTHGLTKSAEYQSWKAMMQRCHNPKDLGFGAYGAVGIVPCARIKASPKSLIELLREKPSRLHELDRIDNKLGYSCGDCDECRRKGWLLNVRWVTRKQNLRNRSNNALFKIGDEVHCASEWAERLGLTRNQFIYRYRANKHAAA